MRITEEAVLKAAGIGTGDGLIEVLRDGFPSHVIRVQSTAFPGRPSVIIKACPDGSREPDVLQSLYNAALPVPAVLDLRQGDGFRAMLLEDVGNDVLYKHPNARSYMRAAAEIARIHRRFDQSDLGAELAKLLPEYDTARWASIIASAARGTLERFEDGTYRGDSLSGGASLPDTLKNLEEETLSIMMEPEQTTSLTRTLVHGDYHEGNVLIRPGEETGFEQLVIVDWGDARWDSGFFDLVSLCEVAHRMGTVVLDYRQVVDSYLQARYAGLGGPSHLAVEVEWHKCSVLRAWDELRWFSETGEDFGDRVPREVETIRSHLRWFRESDAIDGR